MSGAVRDMVMDRAFGDRAPGSGCAMRGLSGSTLKRVLDRLAWVADDDGCAILIGVAKVADDCELSERTVQRAFRELEERGLIVLDAEAAHHAPRTYRIDLEVLGDYPLTPSGEARRRKRAPIDARSRAQGRLAGAEDALSRGDIGDTPAGEAGKPGVTSGAPRGDIGDVRGDIVSAPIEDTPDTQDTRNARARARPVEKPSRGAHGPDGAGGAGGLGGAAARAAEEQDPDPDPDDQADLIPPACAVWNERWDAIQASMAGEIARCCVPDHDSGRDLLLAVGEPLVGWAVLQWAAPVLGPILGRQIGCVVRRWVQPALYSRGHEHESRLYAGPAPACADEIVTLKDPAWTAWMEARTALAEWPAVGEQSLPLTLSEEHYAVAFGGGVAFLSEHLEEAEAWLTRIFAMPVKLRCRLLDVHLALRRRSEEREAA